MSTPVSIANMDPRDLRNEWRRRPARAAFDAAPGQHSTAIVGYGVTWSWRPDKAMRHDRASRVRVWRDAGRLMVNVSDATGPAGGRVESRRSQLHTWEQLEALVMSLAEGLPMVPQAATLGEVAP